MHTLAPIIATKLGVRTSQSWTTSLIGRHIVRIAWLRTAIIFAIASPRAWYAVSASRTGELIVGAGFGFAIFLVACVAAVVFRVANPGLCYATPSVAGKLCRVAGHVSAVCLVGAVWTVVVAIAFECQRNTTTSCAVELQFGTIGLAAILFLITTIIVIHC